MEASILTDAVVKTLQKNNNLHNFPLHSPIKNIHPPMKKNIHILFSHFFSFCFGHIYTVNINQLQTG